MHTAQCVGSGEAIDNPPPDWPGFQQIWIPVAENLELSGRLGLAKKADKPIKADCIVILPGMWGDNSIVRTRDLAAALLGCGFHVLALELRGHGQTEARYPNVYYNFGVLESQDLMKVSQWLVNHEYIARTGLVGYCWGANHALIAAWYDGRQQDAPSISENFRQILDPVSNKRHFTAGVIAFSPVLRWEEFIDYTDIPHSIFEDPAVHIFQQNLNGRSQRKGYPDISGNLRRLIEYEFAHSELTSSFPLTEVYTFIRLLPYQSLPSHRKLESARIPVLIVHSINDPLKTAQEVADLVAYTKNDKVAALLLPGGGHVGIAAYARDYYYSLIVNFFDPENGAAAYADSP